MSFDGDLRHISGERTPAMLTARLASLRTRAALLQPWPPNLKLLWSSGGNH